MFFGAQNETENYVARQRSKQAPTMSYAGRRIMTSILRDTCIKNKTFPTLESTIYWSFINDYYINKSNVIASNKC